ncbi:PIN domain-containing protein [Candidatus Peregrinibacteria bacterium]|nr:PIN domain-containing protein [Candidatus Peregrinibacteria bacterium]
MPYVLLSEILTVLSYKHSKKLANFVLDYILTDIRFILIESITLEELSFWRDISTKISFADITLVFLAYKYNASLVTFDKEQEKLYLKYK